MSAEDKFVVKKRYLFWLSAFIALFYVFYQIKSVLLPFAISFIIVVFFNGIVNKLEKVKIPRVYRLMGQVASIFAIDKNKVKLNRSNDNNNWTYTCRCIRRLCL